MKKILLFTVVLLSFASCNSDYSGVYRITDYSYYESDKSDSYNAKKESEERERYIGASMEVEQIGDYYKVSLLKNGKLRESQLFRKEGSQYIGHERESTNVLQFKSNSTLVINITGEGGAIEITISK